MGQYYTPYFRNEQTGEVSTLYSHEYGSGLKLMEHSRLGNRFVNAGFTLIENNAMRVAWVGDYSEDVGCDEDVFDECWRRDDFFKKNPTPIDYFADGEGNPNGNPHGYLINHSKEEVVDIKEYAELANDGDGRIVNPLPLLTAIGNGLGGGDYRGCNLEMVGRWYLDLIEFNQEWKPESYTDITKEVIFS